ncbi:MAG: response regulator [Pseudomonadota bacterium]
MIFCIYQKEFIMCAEAKMLKILVVDDTLSVRKLLMRLLSSMGHHVTTAENGASALQILSEQSLDIALIDWSMPGMDGLELAKKIHETYPDIGISIMTGWVHQQENERLSEIGVKGIIEKPFDMNAIKKLLESHSHMKKL